MNCLNNKFSTAKERFSELENRLEKYQPKCISERQDREYRRTDTEEEGMKRFN